MARDMACDELAYRRASESNAGPVKGASLLVGIDVPQRHRADDTQRRSVADRFDAHAEQSPVTVAVARTQA
jgi:hypothetical protein